MKYDAVVLGGGLYGTHVALELRKQRLKVALIEPGRLLDGATRVNQGRVHEGFHYPRSAATAMTAAKYYERFIIDFAPAISQNKKHLYLIAEDSKVSPIEYEKVLDEIGAGYKKIKTPSIFTKGKIQQCYETHEVAFNVNALRDLIRSQLQLSGVTLIRDYGVIGQYPDGRVFVRPSKSREDIQTDYIFNCTYAAIDRVVSGWRTPLRKEHVEVAVVEAPAEIREQDITLMNGEFWSIMHYPPSDNFMALTHVKYGRHAIWNPPDESEPEWAEWNPNNKKSNLNLMIEDAIRYCPMMWKAKHVGSLFTTRTLVRDTMGDDSRPVIVEFHKNTPRIISILGSKFNSIYDLDPFLKEGEWAR